MADRKRKELFGDLKRYSVTIPLDDFLKFAQMAKDYESICQSLERVEQQCIAMRKMYFELVEKVSEIDKML